MCEGGGSQQGLGGFRTREGTSVSETVPADRRAASGLSRAWWRGEDGSLRSKMREPPLSASESRERHGAIRSLRPASRVFRVSSGASRWQAQRHSRATDGRNDTPPSRGIGCGGLLPSAQ